MYKWPLLREQSRGEQSKAAVVVAAAIWPVLFSLGKLHCWDGLSGRNSLQLLSWNGWPSPGHGFWF